jgi:hypothetical protein
VDARSCTSPPGLHVTGCALAALHLIELVAAVRRAMLVSVMGVHVELVAEEAFSVGRGSRGTGGGGARPVKEFLINTEVDRKIEKILRDLRKI